MTLWFAGKPQLFETRSRSTGTPRSLGRRAVVTSSPDHDAARRYFFDLEECGSPTPDLEGQICLDVDDARTRAVQAARAIMATEVKNGHLCLGCKIEIFDERRIKVATVNFRDVVAVTGT